MSAEEMSAEEITCAQNVCGRKKEKRCGTREESYRKQRGKSIKKHSIVIKRIYMPKPQNVKIIELVMLNGKFGKMSGLNGKNVGNGIG